MKFLPQNKKNENKYLTLKEYRKKHTITKDIVMVTAFSFGLALTPLFTSCNPKPRHLAGVTKVPVHENVEPKNDSKKVDDKKDDKKIEEVQKKGEIKKPMHLDGVSVQTKINEDDKVPCNDEKKDEKKDEDKKIDKPLLIKGRKVIKK